MLFIYWKRANKARATIWLSRVLISLNLLCSTLFETNHFWPDIIVWITLLALWMHFAKLYIPAVLVAAYAFVDINMYIYYLY